MSYPDDRKYTKDHEWVRVSGSLAEIGITDYAQQQLGDVVYVELPDVGAQVAASQTFGSIESVKAVSELFAPMSGRVTEVNDHVRQHPEAVNADPHGTWIIKVDVSNPGEAAALLDSQQYQKLLA
ncbi:MAG TPA: glycine cleavage system protein GcvH [Vicinamibacterales bacterium]